MDEIIKKIKMKGYWKIKIFPNNFEEQRIPLDKCEEIVEKSVLNLIGWPYPLFNHQIPVKRGQDWIEVTGDYDSEIEAWRFYQSGQFVQYVGLWEDLGYLDSIGKHNTRFDKIVPKSILALDWLVFTITQCFEFASRIAKQEIYKDGVNIEMELYDIKDRKLFILDSNRAGFFVDYKTAAEKLLYQKKNISEEEIITNSKGLSLDAILWFVERFSWKNPNVEALKDMQDKLLNKRL